MNLHEFQAKQYFNEFAIPVPKGMTISQQMPWRESIASLSGEEYIVKAQVHAGGRGKAGGVVWTRNKQELLDTCERLLGSRLVTAQTGSDGLPIHYLLIEQPVSIAQEFYIGITIDRSSRSVMLICSAEGGTNIEEVARTQPDQIIKQSVSLGFGIQPYQCRRLAKQLRLAAETHQEFCAILKQAFRLFVQLDASLLEINPLILTKDQQLVALDAKLSMDENALFRHSDQQKLRDDSQQSPIEVQAAEHGLNYVKLDGNIGCVVNGAGLAMATMDLISLRGGQPANFLDVGGDTDAKRVAAAFSLLMSDKDVRCILVNIFGGIVRCDVIANGIIESLQQVELNVPVVVLLQGTNAAAGKALLQDHHPLLFPAEDFETAASEAIAKATAQ